MSRRRKKGDVLSRPDIGEHWTIYGHVTAEEAAAAINGDYRTIVGPEVEYAAYQPEELQVRHILARCQRYCEGESAEGHGYSHWVVELCGREAGPGHGVFEATEVTRVPLSLGAS